MNIDFKKLGKVRPTVEGDWNKNKSYRELSIVFDEESNKSYISKKPVPSGISILNKNYWHRFGNNRIDSDSIIILSHKDTDGNINSFTLKEAIDSISVEDRRLGMFLSFYEKPIGVNDNYRWNMYQFNADNIDYWNDETAWSSIYYSKTKFFGLQLSEEALYNVRKNPDVGDYAFVGTTLKEAVVYRCYSKNNWSKTAEPAINYITVMLQGNVTVGENGNWFQNGVDTGIKAQGPKGDKGDNIKGDKGDTPLMRLSKEDGYVQYGYDGEHWENLVPLSEFVANIDNNPDEEDITVSEEKLKFADRAYNPSSFSGKGYKILRKNIQNGKNVLNSLMITEENTVYIVKYDFEVINYLPLPSGVSFIFDGGSITANNRSKIIRSKKINSGTIGELVHLYGDVRDSVKAFLQEEIIVHDSCFINVLDFGIDNRGVEDCSTKLNDLFSFFARGITYYSSLVFYFPKGTYLISSPIIIKGVNQTIIGESISNSKTAFINDGTIFKYTGGSDTYCFTYEKGTSAGCNFKNITIISDSCRVKRKAINSEDDIWNGTNAQHYIIYTETTPRVGAIELQSNKSVDNCLIYGFSGNAISTSIFNKISNSCFYNCNTCIYVSNEDYNADTIIDNCHFTYSKIGIIGNNTILVRNSWFDELSEYGVYNNYNEDNNLGGIALEMHNTHMNHIDYNAIHGKLRRTNISGCTFNRCNCYYAGYTWDNVPEEDKDKCSTIYIEDGEYSVIEFNQSGLEMLDTGINGNKGGACSVVPIVVKTSLKNYNIKIIGRSNENLPIFKIGSIITENTKIIYNNKEYDFNYNNYIDKLGNIYSIKYQGEFSQKPTSAQNIPIGFQYFCTDKYNLEENKNGIVIYYKGDDIWVDSLGNIVNENYPFKIKGTFSEKPINEQGVPVGFKYYCTDMKIAEGNHRGVYIYHKGNDIWTTSDGIDVTDVNSLYHKREGTTEERPELPPEGFVYRDTTLNKLIWYFNGTWYDNTGAEVGA